MPLQRELYQQLRDEAIATRERIEAIVRPLDLSKINEHPEPEGWSVGQVLEHLCKAGEEYEAPLAAAMQKAEPDPDASAREWKPSLMGGMIAGSILKPKPLKAPKVFRPGPTPRGGVLEALLALELKFLKTMDDAASLDWNARIIRSPALPSWVPKMNLGDAFRIHFVHLTRHSHQVERVAGKL